MAAAGLGIVLVFAGDGGEDDESADAPPASLPEPVETDDGWVVRSVGWVPGATALAAVDGAVYVTETGAGTRYAVVDPSSSEPSLSDPEPFGSIARVDRAVPAPTGGDAWVAEGRELVRLDAEGEVLDTIALEHPGSVVAVTDDAVWLTVSGIPVAHADGVASPSSVLQRVDIETSEVLAVPVEDPVDFNVAIADGQVWVTVGATLMQLDPVTVEPIDEVELDAPASAVAIGDGEVLVVVGGDAPQVVRVVDGEVAGTVDLPVGAVGEAALVDGPDGTELWVLRPDGDAVDRVALADGSIQSLEVVEPRRIEVTDDGVWLLGGADDGLVLVARHAS